MMLRRSPRPLVRLVAGRTGAWFRSGPSRLRLRRRLMLYSSPVLVILLLCAVKMIGVVVIGNSAVRDFADHDIDALRSDVSTLKLFDVIDPAKTAFAAGDLDVLEGRLTDADQSFSESLSRTSQSDSCPVRVNTVLVQETLGDLAVRSGRLDDADRLYNSAADIVREAPGGCFDGNDDANADRRAIRADSLARLARKLDVVHKPPKPVAPGAVTVTPAPPPIPGAPGGTVTSAPMATPAPGENLPQPPAPELGPTPNTPQQPGTPPPGQVPIFGPEHPPESQSEKGPGVLDPVGADRLPTIGGSGQGSSGPGQSLQPGSGNPVDRLQILLDNANAYGDNGE